jgi:hypothetical protein
MILFNTRTLQRPLLDEIYYLKTTVDRLFVLFIVSYIQAFSVVAVNCNFENIKLFFMLHHIWSLITRLLQRVIVVD